MRKFVLASTLVCVGAFGAAPAAADTVVGECRVSLGTASFADPIGGLPPVSSSYLFTSSQVSCSGTVNGVARNNVPAQANVGGPATLSCLAGHGADSVGKLTLDPNGASPIVVDFTMDFVSAGAGVAVSLTGAEGGAAAGVAEFASRADAGVVNRCASNTLRSLNFSAIVRTGPEGLSG